MPVDARCALLTCYFFAPFGPGRTEQLVLFVQLVLLVLFVLLPATAVIGCPVCATRDTLRSSFVLFTVIDIGFTFATGFTARLFLGQWIDRTMLFSEGTIGNRAVTLKNEWQTAHRACSRNFPEG
ncbi:hypothetical protein GCM10010492_54940 [Saccharothrix mutabilis subsp. mutabilis]|uniref:Uncharacterized protein n=1 Tax=Saccharothrix mutabilis subsp. mutabilis TaxID=66855 RepID=A0ABP3DZW1_9PSEU